MNIKGWQKYQYFRGIQIFFSFFQLTVIFLLRSKIGSFNSG